MACIGFIGLGKMGAGMATRLLAAGHELRVYNRSPAKAEPLARAGARVCASPAEASTNASAIISMVAEDAASREVWLGAGGVLTQSKFAPGAFAIECSTLSHDWVQSLAVEAGRRGMRYIDAPVTGLPDDAAAGNLTSLVGAATVDLEGSRGLLGAFSQRVIHFGAVGTGTAYKLIVNLLGAIQIASAAESMALAERAGLDLQLVADALAGGQAASPQVVRNTQRMVAGASDRRVVFTPRLRLKDVQYALQLAARLNLGAPFGTLAESVFAELCAAGQGDENESVVFDVARGRRP